MILLIYRVKLAVLTKRLGKRLADKEYYERNKDKVKATVRAYHYANRDAVLAKMANRVVDQKKLYAVRKEKCPEYSKVSKANQDAKSWLAPGTITSKEIREMLVSQEYKCHYCSQLLDNKYSLDHKVPFCKGGTNYITNIVIACRPCNYKKHITDYEDFKGVTL